MLSFHLWEHPTCCTSLSFWGWGRFCNETPLLLPRGGFRWPRSPKAVSSGASWALVADFARCLLIAVLHVPSKQKAQLAGGREVRGSGSSRELLARRRLCFSRIPSPPPNQLLAFLLPPSPSSSPGATSARVSWQENWELAAAPCPHPSTAAPLRAHKHFFSASSLFAALYIQYNPPTGYPDCTWLGRTEHPCDSKGQNECQYSVSKNAKSASGTQGARRDLAVGCAAP